MGTPITFSGFNDIDFNMVLNAIMQQASIPLVSLQDHQKDLQSQIGSLDKLAGLVSTLRSTADTLGRPSTHTMLTATSSDPQAVSVSVGAGAPAGQIDVVVTQLARAQVSVSDSSAPDANTTIVASGGTITIGGVAVTLTGDVTLQGLADAINSTPDIGVTAGVIRTGPTTYRLALTGNETGLANAFTITNGLSGGAGVTFAANAVEAADASLLVNNVAVTGPTNTFTDVMSGVSLTVYRADPGATVRLDVSVDGAAVKDTIKQFVAAYNEFVAFVGEQRSASAQGDAAAIGRDPVLRALRNDLRTSLLGAHGTGVLTRLAEAGVEFTQTGQLELDEAVFDAAVAADADAVRGLFSAADGAFNAVETLLDGYGQADGLIPAGKRRLEDQISTMNEQIDAMQRRLAIQRESMQRQFAEADLIMSRLKAQATALSGFSSDLGTF
jgi:flagellar hook-associated protein 2